MCCCSSCVKGYNCLGWIFSSIFFAVLLFAMFLAIRIASGGTLPTQNWETGHALIYTSSVFTVLTSIGIFITITKFSDNILRLGSLFRWIIFGVTNALLVITLLLLLSATILIAKKVTKEDVISYSRDHYVANGNMPAGIHVTEKLSSNLIQDGVPLGCCGYKDFNDYLGPQGLKKCDNDTKDITDRKPILFNAVPSCCKDKYCGNLTLLKSNVYLSYDIQLFIHRLFNVKAKHTKNWNDIKALSKKLGQEFSDWISGAGDEGGKKKVFGEGELPPSNKDITYSPKLDCPYAVKTQMKTHIGNWDNETEWEYTGEDRKSLGMKTKLDAGDNYIESVKHEVRTAVLGCGEFLQLLLEGNNFVKLAFENGIPGGEHLFPLIMAVHGIILAFVIIFLVHVILNLLFFNYYFIPTVLFPDKFNLPFFPKKNKVIPDEAATAAEAPTQQPSPTGDAPAEVNPDAGEAEAA